MSNITHPTPETPTQKEARIFKELFGRLIDALLNKAFDLRPKKAVRRMWYLVILFFACGFLVSLNYYPLNLWTPFIEDIFSFLFSVAYDPNFPGDPFVNIIFFGIRVFGDARVLQYLPIFLAPFFIALQSAAIYLADIFELEGVRVARSFILEVALTGSNETIRIAQGEIIDEHRTSSNYLIGGPGKVVVDLDSVALFEKPDGTLRIIGPTGKEPRGKATLDGFERFRQAIDLRDHFIELRDQSEKSNSVKSRSLDGISITATDVRFMFSVYRDGQKPSKENPYPFSQEAIERLIYKATSRVTPDLTNPSSFEFSWVNNMISLIRSRLGKFMSERKLTAYLASIGLPEIEKAKKQEETIAKDARQIIPPTESEPEKKEVKPPPEFTPRYKITNLFAQFADEFTKSARDRGVELHWIGVGTWKTPIENIAEKHLEAWKISSENAIRGNEEILARIQGEAELHKSIALIQNLPLYAYQEISNDFPDRNKAIKSLLLEYQRFLKDQLEFLQKNKLPIKPTLVATIYYIDRMISHRLYPPPPPARTARERELYSYLLASTEMPEVIEKLVELKSEIYPQASREELLKLIADDWDHDVEFDK